MPKNNDKWGTFKITERGASGTKRNGFLVGCVIAFAVLFGAWVYLGISLDDVERFFRSLGWALLGAAALVLALYLVLRPGREEKERW